jgi:hypothetical protein
VVAIVSVETVLLVLLVVLVAALLRSHAEILRRLGPEGSVAPAIPTPSGTRTGIDAPEIVGITPTGDAVKLSLSGGRTLLGFLSTGCTSCAPFWETLGEHPLPHGLQPMIVTRGPDREQRSKLRSIAPGRVPVVMSSEAWEQYAVPGSPYFVMVEGGEIRGEGVATTWEALTSLVGDAVEEQLGIDERLAAAGIGADHPSLYLSSAAPSGGASPGERA